MFLREFVKEGIRSLSAFYPQDEARKLVLLLTEFRLGVKSYTHIIEPETMISTGDEVQLSEDITRLLGGEPIQYILGEADFYGRKFKVTPEVLIPRPETEILVQEALRHIHRGSRVLDLCTGSGCIAWTVALEEPGACVKAVDVSQQALKLAASQPFDNGPSFYLADILNTPDPSLFGTVDVIMSNPPYIMESEKGSIRKNVLDYEPELALFVPDSDPLVFNRAISVWAERLLAPGGFAIVEINEKLGAETINLFEEAHFNGVETVNDFSQKNRFVVFYK